MDVTVQMLPHVAQAWRGVSAPHEHATQIRRVLESLGVTLTPIHPDTTDSALATFFSIAVPGNVEAREVVDRLLPLPGIDGAYVKPPSRAP